MLICLRRQSCWCGETSLSQQQARALKGNTTLWLTVECALLLESCFRKKFMNLLKVFFWPLWDWVYCSGVLSQREFARQSRAGILILQRPTVQLASLHICVSVVKFDCVILFLEVLEQSTNHNGDGDGRGGRRRRKCPSLISKDSHGHSWLSYSLGSWVFSYAASYIPFSQWGHLIINPTTPSVPLDQPSFTCTNCSPVLHQGLTGNRRTVRFITLWNLLHASVPQGSASKTCDIYIYNRAEQYIRALWSLSHMCIHHG